MAAIDIRGVTKTYGSVTALSDLTVSFPEGIVGLVGANGAGKSTLIKVLLGLTPATAGSADVLGFDAATEGIAVREKVGYMPESECLPLDLNGTEFVVHMARISGLPYNAARERAADTLRHVGLYEERYRPMREYSTGMRQRAKLAQALVHDPELVLLDEPTNGLDPAGRDEMLALIERIGRDFGISVIVTSHLLGELERVADHIVAIEAGTLQSSTAVSHATRALDDVVIEVTEGGDAITKKIAAAGVAVEQSDDHNIFTVLAPTPEQLDAAVAAVAGAKVGLVRLQRGRHRLSEVLFEGAAS